MHHVDTNPTSAKHCHRAPQFHLGSVDHRADASNHSAAEKGRLFERKIIWNFQNRFLGNNRIVGKARHAAEVLDLLAVELKPSGAV